MLIPNVNQKAIYFVIILQLIAEFAHAASSF